MPTCRCRDCSCDRDVSDLKRDLDYLRLDFDALKRDLQREASDRRDSVSELDSMVSGAYRQLHDHVQLHTAPQANG